MSETLINKDPKNISVSKAIYFLSNMMVDYTEWCQLYSLLEDNNLPLVAPEKYFELATKLVSAELVCHGYQEEEYKNKRNKLMRCMSEATRVAKATNKPVASALYGVLQSHKDKEQEEVVTHAGKK